MNQDESAPDMEIMMLTADLNNDRAAHEAYATATQTAAKTGLTGEVRGPVMWSTDGTRIQPVDRYEDGKLVDAYLDRLKGL